MIHSETLIIGGGITGVSTALHLVRHGIDVLLLEKGEIANEASGQNMGGLGGMGWGNVPDLNSHLTMGSLEIFKQLQIDLGYDIEFRQSGSLSGIHTVEQFEYMRDKLIQLKSNGYVGEFLTPREAQSIEPEVNPNLMGYTYAPLRGQADPVKSTRAFANAAQKMGASVKTGQEVISIAVGSAKGYTLTTVQETYVCDTLVLACGAWCGPVGEMLGLNIPVVPIRGQMWATSSLPPRIFHDISSAESSFKWSQNDGSDNYTPPNLTHDNNQRITRHLYGRQRRNGEIIFGGDRQELGYNMTPETAGIKINYGHAAEVIPLLATLPITRTWAGLMPFTLDGDPIVGKIPVRDNLYVVSGLASSGFGRGPMAGKLVADYIRSGHMPQILKESDPARCVTELV